MSAFEHSRFRIFNPAQHPLKHDISDLAFNSTRLPGISLLGDAIDYLIAVIYPKYIGTYATMAALLAAVPSPSQNDYALISDDGDGKAAGYVYSTIDGTAAWNKRYDVDWSMENILAETVNRTEYMYLQKYGNDDLDAVGVALTGINAGQHAYGGVSASANLTLHANSGDTIGARTGYVQSDDNMRPTVTNLLNFGTAALRWNIGYFSDLQIATLTATGNVAIGGNLVVTGTVTCSNLSGSNTGDVTLTAVGSTPNANGASLSGQALTLQPASASFPGLVTTGVQTLAGAKTFSSAAVFSAAGTALSVTNNASIGGNLTVTGTVAASNLSGTNTGDLTLAAVGAAPSVNGATLSGQVLTLQPADATRPGLVTAGTQTIAGDKTLTGATTLSSAGTALSVTNNATVGGDLTVTGNIKNGATTFVGSELQKLRNVMFRDAARSSPVQNGDGIFYDLASGTWLASVPDTEIVHNSISGLTTGDAGHTQFVMLAGRSGGQTIQGDTAASGNLLLESTAHATKGSINVKDNLVANTNATYSAGWVGTDLGDATHYFRDVYTKGQHFNFRLEGVAAPANSAQNIGRLIYDGGIIKVDTGAAWDQAVMTTQTQTVGGVKTFTSNVLATAKVGIGTGPITPNVELDILGSFASRRADVASSASIASLATATSLTKLTGTTATTVLGLASGFDGKRVIVHNGTNQTLTINHQDAGATAADRIITSTGSAMSVVANSSAEFVYDSGQSRWVVSSSAAASSGGGGIHVMTATQSVGAGGTVSSSTTDGFQFRRVQGSSGAQTSSTTPFGSGGGWTDGVCISLCGQDDTNTLTVPHNDAAKGFILDGDALLGRGSILTVIYDATADRWFEMSRNF